MYTGKTEEESFTMALPFETLLMSVQFTVRPFLLWNKSVRESLSVLLSHLPHVDLFRTLLKIIR
jgi:hypothetical protein